MYQSEKGAGINRSTTYRVAAVALLGVGVGLGGLGAAGEPVSVALPERGGDGIELASQVTESGMSRAVKQDVPVVGFDSTTVFLSTAHSNDLVSGVRRVDRAVFLGQQRFAFMDGDTRRVYYVDLSRDQVIEAGGDPYSPSTGATLLDRDSTGGVVVVEPYGETGHLTLFGANGRLATVVETGFVGPVVWKPIGLFRDGTLILRRPAQASPLSLQSPFTRSDGQVVRRPTQFEMWPKDADSLVFAEALGDEMQAVTVVEGRRGSTHTIRIIFGHQLLASRVGDYVAIGQTDRDRIDIYDPRGRRVGGIPMPLPRRALPSPEAISAHRNIRLHEYRENNRARIASRNEALSEAFADFGVSPPNRGFLNRADSIRVSRLQVSAELPPIDRLHGDAEDRLWIRRFSVARDTVVVWEVWNPSPPSLEFYVTMTPSDRLLDAIGDRVMLLVSDGFSDQDYIAIKTLVDRDDNALPARQSSQTTAVASYRFGSQIFHEPSCAFAQGIPAPG